MKKEDFDLWMTNPVTIAVMEAVRERELEVTEQLVKNVDETNNPDELLRGYIAGCRNLTQIEFADVE